ncbi:MAG: filamentous hemagglutinin N-terminal domain-containing protein [Calothrix sp. FI2-JRJ7]|jgi:filamentous hemagglutinin family protein|nr:filamentous hemagglutinin N-terminal domain-containing protein [Calothrix sp. FI2-JRJ7]
MLLSQYKGCCIGIAITCCFTNNAIAQIKPDSTLPINSSVTESENVSVISGGTKAGSNLFHSFEEFSITSGQTAYFTNSTNIVNIISRVTGKQASNIDGSIRASGATNLFFINPNGIIFGTNASLDIGGSFLASTASAFKFADGTMYSATFHKDKALLTVSTPTGLQFGTTASPIRITSQASTDGVTNSLGAPVGLRVPDGKTLSLIGGNIIFEGGNLTASRGQIELISVAGNNSVNLNPTSQLWTLDKTEAQNLQDIKLFERNVGGQNIPSMVDTGSNIASGSIYVQGRVVELSGNLVNLGTLNQGSIDGQGITINAIKLIVRDGAQIYTSTLGTGAAGDIQANVFELVQLSDNSKFLFNDNVVYTSLFSTTSASGRAGNITINTKNLYIQGAQISTGSEGIRLLLLNQYIPATGVGGNLTINALKGVEIIGKTDNPNIGLFAGTESSGDAGNLKLTTGTLIVRSGGAVTVSSKITRDEIYLGDTSKLGTAGNLDIQARNILLDTSAKITSETDLGRGGNINLLVRDLLLMRRGSQISTSAGRLDSAGDGGNITIDIPTGFIVAPPQENNDITTNAYLGSGGKVQIDAISLFGVAPLSREDLVRKLKINNGTNSSVLDPDSLPTSDITAISQENPTLNGIVNINTLDNSINRTIINLPTQLVEQKVAQSCSSNIVRGESQFVVTGRGGLPISPRDLIRTNTTLEPDWVSVGRGDSESRQDSLPYAPSKINTDSSRYPMKIVEAQGWVRSSKGDLYLVANTPFTKIDTPRFQSISCRR